MYNSNSHKLSLFAHHAPLFAHHTSRSFHELEEFKSKEAAARMQVQLRVAAHASSSLGT
jgi:hypothetical protein